MRVVMAWLLPMATARASTPESATKARASAGSVRAPAAWASSGGSPCLPPTCPNSASIHSPWAWAQSAAARVAARLSAYGRRAASYITEPNPASAA